MFPVIRPSVNALVFLFKFEERMLCHRYVRRDTTMKLVKAPLAQKDNGRSPRAI